VLIKGLVIVGRSLKCSIEAGFSTTLISLPLSSLASLSLTTASATTAATTRLLGKYLGFLDKGELICTLGLRHGCLVQKKGRAIERCHTTALLSATESKHLTVKWPGSTGAASLTASLVSAASLVSTTAATDLSVALCHSTYPRIFLAPVPDLQQDPAVRSRRSELLFF